MSNLEPTSLSDGCLKLSGALTFETVPRIWQEAQEFWKSGQAVSEVDLQQVGRTDSAGLSLLLEWQAQAQAAGRRLRLHGLPSDLRRLARLCEAEELLRADTDSKSDPDVNEIAGPHTGQPQPGAGA